MSMDRQTIVGYVQGSNSPTTLGNLKDGCTITIEGAVYNIPNHAKVGGRLAPHRITETLEAAGYRPATDYHSDLGDPNADGVFEIRLVVSTSMDRKNASAHMPLGIFSGDRLMATADPTADFTGEHTRAAVAKSTGMAETDLEILLLCHLHPTSSAVDCLDCEPV